MKKTIYDIVGATIQKLEEVYDYWQLGTDKASINIYNAAKYYTPLENELELSELRQDDLVNAIITKVECEENFIKIEINQNKALIISLSSKDYYGPEAIDVHFNTGEIIVFN